jgi:hypothetical protein
VSFFKPPQVIMSHRCVHPTQGGWFELHEHAPATGRRTLRGLIASVEVWLQETSKGLNAYRISA